MTQLSRYTLLEKIGNSVLGTVYKAQDTASGSPVTLRVLQLGLLDEASGREMDARLQRCLAAAERLRHPAIARVLEVGREGRTALVASEFVDGPTITSFVRASAGSDLAQVVTAVVQLLEALDFAHSQSMVHRDLKPANVRVQGTGIKITDFGLADLGAGVRDDAGTLADRTEYMAPEQFQGGTVDRRCDIHATGAILYELLTGKSPFAGDGRDLSAMPRVRDFVPPPPSRVRPGLSAAFDRLVARALAKNPTERFATAQQFRNELAADYEALTRRPPPDTLVRGTFAPPRPATAAQSRPAPAVPTVLPADDRAEARKTAAQAPPVKPPEKAPPPAPARPAATPSSPAAPDAFRAGNTLPGTRRDPPAAADLRPNQARPDAAPARAGEAEKPAAPRVQPETPKVPAAAEPAMASRPSVRPQEPAASAAPVRAASKDASAASADMTEPISAAAPTPKVFGTKPLEKKEESAPGGTMLVVPKPQPAPASSDPKERIRAPAPAVDQPEVPRAKGPLPGGTPSATPKVAAASAVSSDLHELVRQAVAVEVIQSQPAQARQADKYRPVSGGTMLLTPKASVGASANAAESARPPAPVPAADPAPASAKESVTVWAPAPEESGLFRAHRQPGMAQTSTRSAAPPAESAKPAAPPEASVQPPTPGLDGSGAAPRPRPAKQIIPLTDASIAHAGRVLAQFLGPIATVLSRRAAQDAHDERGYFELLAAHLPDPDERSQFLRAVRQRRS